MICLTLKFVFYFFKTWGMTLTLSDLENTIDGPKLYTSWYGTYHIYMYSYNYNIFYIIYYIL